jgi:GNAT superfamily N-acetyltransferase
MVPKAEQLPFWQNHALQLEEVDFARFTDSQWTAFNALLDRERAENDPQDPPIEVPDTVVRFTTIPPVVHRIHWLVWQEGEAVAQAHARYLEGETNQHALDFDVYVAAPLRRRGVARELLRLIADAAEALERPLLITDTSSTVPAGEAFMRRVGAELGLTERQSQLDIVTLDGALLQRWMARASALDAEFELGLWDGPYPDEDIQAVVTMKEIMNTAPIDDLELEDHKWTVAQLRAQEEAQAQRDIQRWTIYVRHRHSRAIAGYTEVLWNPSHPQLARQDDTAVHPDYRGRGLGRWLKAAMLEKILQNHPEIKYVRTENAISNDAMLKINTELGFKPYKDYHVWQVTVERVRAYLNETVQ